MQTRPRASEGLELIRPPVSNAQRTWPVSASTAKSRPSVAPKYATALGDRGRRLDDRVRPQLPDELAALPCQRGHRAVLRADDQVVAGDRRGRRLRRVADLLPDHLARLGVDRPRVALERVHVEDAVAVARRVLDVLAEPSRPERLPLGQAELDGGTRERAAGVAAEHRPAAGVDVRLRAPASAAWAAGSSSPAAGRSASTTVTSVTSVSSVPDGSERVVEEREPDPGHQGENDARLRRSRRRMARIGSEVPPAQCACGPGYDRSSGAPPHGVLTIAVRWLRAFSTP